MPCRHPDIRKFDGIRCCLACGEAIFETPQLTPSTQVDTYAQYQYNGLSTNFGQEIRLVVLLPGERSEPIRCEIIHVDLEIHPQFEAVSYTWATEDGDDSKSKFVHLKNSGTMPVTTNCEAALRQLRMLSQKRRLWVDAICIDQANLCERNYQVGLMDKIFSGAENVIICIPAMQTEWTGFTAPNSTLWYLFCWMQGVIPVHYEHEHAISSSLRQLLTSRYFQRVWVIQEVALAKNVHLYVNEHKVELSFAILDRIREKSEVPAPLRWNPGLINQSDVLSCLRAGIGSQCSDQRDGVFAVLSLMEPRARSLISVDYSLSVEEVYTNALLAMITTYENLSLLTYVTLEYGGLYLNGRTENASVMTMDNFKHYLSEKVSFDWSSQVMSESIGPRRMMLDDCHQHGEGTSLLWRPEVKVQTTVSLDNYIDANSIDDINSTVVFETRCIVNPSCLIPRFRARAHFIDTITWKQDPGNAWKQSHDSSNYTEYFQFKFCSKFLPFFSNTPYPESLFSALRLNLGPEQYITTENAPDINIPDLEDFFKNLRGFGVRNLMFTTHYSIGYARGHDILPGDAIYVVDGARIPFIMRKIGPEQYKIVTVCYMWAVLELDYWNPGTRKGIWGSRYHNHGCEQTQLITVH
jgi:hypothetical protein